MERSNRPLTAAFERLKRFVVGSSTGALPRLSAVAMTVALVATFRVCAGNPSDSYPDGSAGAASATVAYPAALSGYKVRAPWRVPDVDYAVGPPASQVFWDPATRAPSCAQFVGGGTSQYLRIISNGCVLDGPDFCQHGGMGVYVPGGVVGTVITHFKLCSTKRASAGGTDIINAQGVDLTVTYGDLNGEAARGAGSGVSGAPSAVAFSGSGKLVFEHNRVYNWDDKVLDVAVPASQGNAAGMSIQFNSIRNTGMASSLPSPPHGEFVYFCGPSFSDVKEDYNFAIEEYGTPGLSNVAALVMDGDPSCGAKTGVTNSELDNNVIIIQGAQSARGSNNPAAQSAAAATFFVGVLSNSAESNNYIDYRGAFFPYFPLPSGNTQSGNINMVTGQPCSNASC